MILIFIPKFEKPEKYTIKSLNTINYLVNLTVLINKKKKDFEYG